MIVAKCTGAAGRRRRRERSRHTIANGATIELDPNGNLCIHTHRNMDLIVDITGYVAQT